MISESGDSPSDYGPTALIHFLLTRSLIIHLCEVYFCFYLHPKSYLFIEIKTSAFIKVVGSSNCDLFLYP